MSTFFGIFFIFVELEFFLVFLRFFWTTTNKFLICNYIFCMFLILLKSLDTSASNFWIFVALILQWFQNLVVYIKLFVNIYFQFLNKFLYSYSTPTKLFWLYHILAKKSRLHSTTKNTYSADNFKLFCNLKKPIK